MKILVICQHYWPENFRVTEISEELVAARPSGDRFGRPAQLSHAAVIPEEYRHHRNRRQVRNGVEIRRCFEIGRKPGKVGLALNYVSYMLSACHQALWMKKDFDVIYAFSTSPVLMSLPGAFLRTFSASKKAADLYHGHLAGLPCGDERSRNGASVSFYEAGQPSYLWPGRQVGLFL